MNMSKTYFGVDISEHNGTVDWSALAKKVDFAILRIGWVGNNSNKMDIRFVENYKAAKKAGVKLGAYVYMYSKSTSAAIKGAEWILKQIKGYDFELPIYCDMEDASIAGLGKKTLTDITDGFNRTIKAAGYTVGIYANKYWFDSKLNPSVKKYHTWIAHYTSGTGKYKGEYEMWQNSSDGSVSGVKGRVDTNYLYEDVFASDKPSAPKPSTTTAKKTVDEIAREVINGKWGNGDERKKKLTSAGYNYNAVQKKVNELVSATKKKSITEIAKEVIRGKWGNGSARKSRLEKAGYNYNAVQKKVNELLYGK